MGIYVMLTKISPYAVKNLEKLKEIEQHAEKLIEENCPNVKWLMNLVVFGPYDYLDIFEAPSDEEAAKVAMIIRSFGHIFGGRQQQHTCKACRQKPMHWAFCAFQKLP